MKKILMAAAMAGLIAGAAFAKSNVKFEASAGFAYGFSDIFATNSNTNTKSEFITNSLGLKAEGTMWLNDTLGIQLDTAFLWPMSTTSKVTDLSNGDTQSDTVNADGGQFVMNGFIGPVFKFNLNKNFDLAVGAGFDVATYANTYSTNNVNGALLNGKSGKVTTSYWNFGIGATVDATYKIDKQMGIKFGVTGAFLWGSQYHTHRHSDDGSYTSDTTTNSNNNAFYIIPDISFVYKF